MVAVVGGGPVGRTAIMTSSLHGASRVIAVDAAKSRLGRATEFGASTTVEAGTNVEQAIMDHTEGVGVDVAIQAVGVPDTFHLCTRIVRPGGTVANIGVHGAPTTLHLEELWIKNVTITTGLVDGVTIPMLLNLVQSGRLPAERLGTHTFGLHEIERAYEVFADAGSHDALKVVLSNASS